MTTFTRPTPPSYDAFICPYCVHVMDHNPNISVCPRCETELPRRYVRNYDTAKPLFLQVFGWSSSGKTVYLQTLILALMRMQRLWSGYFLEAANVQARELMENVNRFGVQLNLPAPTQEELQEAYILLMRNLPRWGGRSLVLRDVAGELCNPMIVDTEVMPYLPHAPSTLMFITLAELEEFRKEGKTMDFLMDSYLYTLETQEIEFNYNRQIIVVLSKADLLLDGKLPQELESYLTSDRIWAATSPRYNSPPQMDNNILDRYIHNMDYASGLVKHWLMNEYTYEAAGLIHRAEANNITLKFSLVSALGSNPILNKNDRSQSMVLEEMKPLRVLDPVFLALDFQSRPE